MSETVEDLRAELKAAREEVGRLTHELADAMRERDAAKKKLGDVLDALERPRSKRS